MKKKNWCDELQRLQQTDLLIVDPWGSQCLLELGEANNVYVDELNHLVPLGGAAGLVPHDPAHNPGN